MGRIIRGQILAGTGPDRHGSGLDRQTIRTLFEQMNSGNSGVDHNLALPPVVRSFNFRLEETHTGELVIKADVEVLDETVFAQMGGFSISYTNTTVRIGPGQEPAAKILLNPRHFDFDQVCKEVAGVNRAGHTVDVTERIEKADILTTAIIVILINGLSEVSKAFLSAVGADLYASLKKRRRSDNPEGAVTIQFVVRQPLQCTLEIDPAVTPEDFSKLRNIDLAAMLPSRVTHNIVRVVGRVNPGPSVQLTYGVLDDGTSVSLKRNEVDEREAYYDTEDVIGSYSKYDRPSCPVVKKITQRNHKRLRSWKSAVALRLEPCVVCRPFYEHPHGPSESKQPKSTNDKTTITASQLADRRRALVQLLSSLDDTTNRPGREGVASRIERLSRSGLIPRYVAPLMRTITEMRNVSEYEAKMLSAAESAVVEASWVAIQEWAQTSGLRLPRDWPASSGNAPP